MTNGPSFSFFTIPWSTKNKRCFDVALKDIFKLSATCPTEAFFLFFRNFKIPSRFISATLFNSLFKHFNSSSSPIFYFIISVYYYITLLYRHSPPEANGWERGRGKKGVNCLFSAPSPPQLEHSSLHYL